MTPSAASARSKVGKGRSDRIDLGPLDIGEFVRLMDERVDARFEPYRGRTVVDSVARIVSGLGDHGLVWAASTAWRARQPGARRSRAVRALAVAGVESSVVNAALKAIIARPRPESGDLRLGDNIVPLRAPRTSSFPSGHTLAAFCAATVLAEEHDPLGNTVLFACAGLVGLSRIHLRAHHASDVVGALAIGIALGVFGRRLVRTSGM
jgi:undecaprenyl-diphosphatase